MTWDPRRDTPPPTPEALAKRQETVEEIRHGRMVAYLEGYSRSANKRRASELAGVHYRTSTRWAAESKERPGEFMVRWPADEEPIPFHEALAVAHEMACDAVEEEIHRRAIEGRERELVFQGRKTGETIKEVSDLQLIFRAKKMIPAYRDNYQVSVQHGGKVEIDSARDRLAEKLMAAIERREQAAALAQADPIDVTPERAAIAAATRREEL